MERLLSAGKDFPVLADGFRTTVSVANVRGRRGYVCDVKCEASWPDLVEVAQFLSEWLEARELNHDVVCSGSQRSWIRFRIYGVSAALAIQLFERWGGVSPAPYERFFYDLHQFEARLLEATREFSRITEQLEAWREQIQVFGNYAVNQSATSRQR